MEALRETLREQVFTVENVQATIERINEELNVPRRELSERHAALTRKIEGLAATIERMLSASKAKPPPVNAILVWDLSRFSRDHQEAQLCTADLRLRGYPIVSILDDVPSGESGMTFEPPIICKNARYLRGPRAATIRGLGALKSGGALALGAGLFWVISVRPARGPPSDAARIALL